MFGHSEWFVYGRFNFDGIEDGMSLDVGLYLYSWGDLILRFNQVGRDMSEYFLYIKIT